MKKVFLLLTAISLSLFAQAKIGYLLFDVETNDGCIECNAPWEGADPENKEVSPERASVIWFNQHYVDPNRSLENNYGDGQFIMKRDFLATDLSEIDVLWIPIGRKVENIDQLNGFLNEEQKTKLIGFIKDGGNVFLSGFATYYVHSLGRMTEDLTNVTCNNWYGHNNDTWAVRLADAEPTHAVWKHLGTPETQDDWKKYPLVSGQRNDRNCLWAGKNWTDFQNVHNCKIWGFWGNGGNPDGAGFIEFYPKDDWKGTIIVNGLAAYQWKRDEYDEDSYKENIKKLTRGVLDYLNTMPTVYGAPKKFGYILPYSMQQMDSYTNENGFRPDYVAAKWFEEKYINSGTGCFLHPKDYSATNLIPQEVEVLWIHNDHVGLTSDQYFTDLGRENFVAALRQFVDRGGKVFLSKQATRLVGDLHLMGIYDNQIDYYYPSYPQADKMGYKDYTTEPKDKWKIRYKYTYDTGESIDYSDHPVYNGFTEYPMIQDNVRRTDNNYLLFHGLNTYNEFTSKESEYQCKLLGCWGHNEGPYEGGLFAEFLPRTAGQGTVIMMGAAAYHWTGNNIDDINSNLKTLTKNILDYLETINTDVYTRDVTNGNYGTICLPRASKTITGATMWRAVDKNAEGVVIEQVSAMEAGVPYFFQATANQLKVEMQGETKPAGKANGLVGHIDVEGKMWPVDWGDNIFVLSQNKLYFVDSDVYLPTNYAYVNINEMSPLAPVAGMPRHTMRLPQSENATTALDNMQTTSAPTKIIQNGQVYILRDGHIYTTLGTQVK